MKVLVCGGRGYRNKKYLFHVLDQIHAGGQPITLIIEGECSGADQLAALWAAARGVKFDPYPADWDRYGNAAGPIRNTQMLIEGRPDLVVSFPGNRGTRDMVTKARKHKVKVHEA